MNVCQIMDSAHKNLEKTPMEALCAHARVVIHWVLTIQIAMVRKKSSNNTNPTFLLNTYMVNSKAGSHEIRNDNRS